MNEIVYVQSPDFLVSQSKEACRYETRGEEPLVAGFYLALWPARARSRQCNRSVRYFGPFSTREAARVVRGGALSFALIGPDSAHPVERKRPAHPVSFITASHCA